MAVNKPRQEPDPLRGFLYELQPLTKLLVLLLISIQAAFCWMAREKSLNGDVDLRAFYAAGTMTRQGNAAHLYDAAEMAKGQQKLFGASGRTLPFLYPAFAALPFVPLSFFPYSTVFVLVLLSNLALLYASARLLSAVVKTSSWWLFGCFLCFFPTSIALMQGQVSCVLLFLLVLSHAMSSRGRMFESGVFLAFALVKFQFVLPIVFLHVLWRRWRVLGGFLLGSAVLVCVSLLLTGVHGAKAYAACMAGLSSMMLQNPAFAQMQFGMQTAAEPNLHGFMTAMTGTHASGTLLLLGASIATVAWAARHCRTVGTALPAAMLVSYHMQPYDLVLLLLPLTFLLTSSWQENPFLPRLTRVVLMASVLLLIAPLAPYLLTHAKTTWFVLSVAGTLFVSGRRMASRACSTDTRCHSYTQDGRLRTCCL